LVDAPPTGPVSRSLPDRAGIVIIGAGIVGCSVAYHLAQRGVKDIVIIEQDRWPEPGGSTQHASNFSFPIDHPEVMAKSSKYGLEFYAALQYQDKSCLITAGGLEIARTNYRMRELKRKVASGKSWGIEAWMVGPGEAKKLFPFLNSRRIKGAMWTPSAGLVTRAVDAAAAMVRETEEMGALRMFPNTQVTDVQVEGGRVRGVHTSRGYIGTDLLICCAGVWGPVIGAMAGAPIPLSPLHHQLMYTSPVPELKGATGQIEWPLLRDQDRSMYVRQEYDGWEVGSYMHPAIITEANDIPSAQDSLLSPTMMPFTEEHFTPAMESVIEVMPVLADAGLQFGFNGLLSVTPDSMPIIGESRQVQWFWAAEAIWVKDAPGAGKMVAEWIVDGVPSIDPHQVDFTRFHDHQLKKEHVSARASEAFQKIYGVIHPQEQWAQGRNNRCSPFYPREQALGAMFFEAAGWERPHWYRSNRRLLQEFEVPQRTGWEEMWWSPVIGAEHQAVRDRVGMFDLTAFQKLDVVGPGALDYIEYLTVHRMDRPIGRAVYTPLVNRYGGIVADLTIQRLGESHFRVITGGGVGMHDLAWFRKHLPENGSVHIQDITSSLAVIGLWGPRARDMLQSVCGNDLSNEAFPFSTVQEIILDAIPASALRISYVGELGWEIYTPSEFGLKLWDLLWEAGQEYGVIAAGLSGYGASLRLEKGYRLWGPDLNTGFNPFEAGLMRDRTFEKPTAIKRADFIGRDALLRIREEGAKQRLCCITFDEPGAVVMGNEPILDREKVVGYVTSSDYGYSVGKGIAYGYLPVSYSEIGTGLEIEYLGRRYPATVAGEPLYDPENLRMRV
jgi:glycine cleavage system aminomethyltransferase T/glycine/D-amino acid oxidase-like deaminating enzyme